MANYGFVYILNHDYMPDVYKIGFTDRAPMQRMQELSASTSVPKDFNLVAYGEFDNAKSMEAFLHKDLDDLRINQNREFFELTTKFIINNLLPWFARNSINYTECNEVKNIQTRYEVLLYEEKNAFSENEFTDEIVEKAAEVIATASSEIGDSNA